MRIAFQPKGIDLSIRPQVRIVDLYFFKMAGSGLASSSEDVRSFTVLLSGSKDYVCLFRATEVRSCCVSFVYALLDSVSYGS